MGKVSFATSGWILIGTTYLISNLFSFTNLIVLYNYVPYKWVLNPYKRIINKALEMFLSGGDINVVLDTIFNTTISFESDPNIEEKIQPSTNGVDGMQEHGFSSEFLNNSWDELLNVGLLVIKILLIRLLLMLPIKVRRLRNYFKSFKKMEMVYLLYEIIAGAPTIMIPIGFVVGEFGEMGVLNISSKMNMAMLGVFPFVLFITPFLLMFYELEQERTKE